MKLDRLSALAALLIVSATPLQATAAKHGRKVEAGPASPKSCAAAWQTRVVAVVEKSYDDLFGSDDPEHDSDMSTIHGKFMAYCQSHGVASATDYFRRSYQDK